MTYGHCLFKLACPMHHLIKAVLSRLFLTVVMHFFLTSAVISCLRFNMLCLSDFKYYEDHPVTSPKLFVSLFSL